MLQSYANNLKILPNWPWHVDWPDQVRRRHPRGRFPQEQPTLLARELPPQHGGKPQNSSPRIYWLLTFFQLVTRLQEVAKRQGCTPAQLSIAWATQACKNVKGNPEVIPIPGAVTKERIEENSKVVKLDEQALKDIEKILGEVEVVGRRYPEHMALEG